MSLATKLRQLQFLLETELKEKQYHLSMTSHIARWLQLHPALQERSGVKFTVDDGVKHWAAFERYKRSAAETQAQIDELRELSTVVLMESYDIRNTPLGSGNLLQSNLFDHE